MKTKAQISIDVNLCTQPEVCRKCLQVCQPCALNLTFRDEDYHDPKDWIIFPAFPQLCLGPECAKCVNICPEDAIRIILKKG